MPTTILPGIEVSEKRSKVIQTFVQCTSDVFSMMLQWDLKLVGILSNDNFMSRYDCSGFIGLSGGVRGSIVVSVDQDLAFAATEAFTGKRPDDITFDVVDLVGELTNMVAGSSKDRLGIPGIFLSLPTVVSGRKHTIWFDKGAHVEILQFSSPHGPLTVEVGLRNHL